MPPRSSSSKSKRKARAVSDSSIEILGSPAPPSPPKKKLATSRTTPAGTDQPIYKAFPSSSSSIIAQLDAIFTESDAAKAPGGTRPPSSRAKVKTEKLKLLVDPAQVLYCSPANSPPEVTPQSDTTASPSTRLRKVALTTPVVSPKKNVSIASITLAPPPNSPTKASSKTRPHTRKFPTPIANSEDSDSDSDLPPYPLPELFKDVLPTGVATLPKAATSDTEQLSGNATNSSTPNKELTPDFVDVDAMDASATGSDENNMSDGTSINPTGEQEDALSGESTDESVDELENPAPTPGSSVVVTTDSVMCKSLQDPALYKIYSPERLPTLGPLRVIHAFGSSGNEPTQRVSFTPLSKKLSDGANAIFLRGLTFDNHGFYVNTSRANPSLLGVNARRVIMANSATNMVGIMLGMLTECFLYREHTSGSANKPYITHKVSILPLAQEFRRDTTVWGQVLNFHRIVASVSDDGISFHTRPKILGPETVVSSPATPRKPRGGIYLTVNSSPATSQKQSSGLTCTSYPGSRAFEDDIPIYDGRGKKGPPFHFTDKNFQDIHTFPLYKGGREDILAEALVAVGYTLNTFGEKPQLSTNVQFLILLGVPV